MISEGLEWIKPYLGWLTLVSALMFLTSLVIVHRVLVMIPADYFARPERRLLDGWSPPARIAAILLKNLFGVVCIFGGLVMLLTPGQGVLTLLVGISLMDLPGKRRLVRAILTRPLVWKSMNRFRHRAGRSPLIEPDV